jgi:hypothetical protein
MSVLFFGLGAVAAVVVVSITALVVIVFKLMKEVRVLRESSVEDRRNMNSEIGSVVNMIDTSCKDYLEQAKKYTDSRLDKMSEKLSK